MTRKNPVISYFRGGSLKSRLSIRAFTKSFNPGTQRAVGALMSTLQETFDPSFDEGFGHIHENLFWSTVLPSTARAGEP